MALIRDAGADDSAAIARLGAELGYPASTAQMRERLAVAARSALNRVLVAEADGCVIAWLHVAVIGHLTAAAEAEILGLVVAAQSRGAGIGADLLRAAEQWAQAQGVRQLTLRSRVERERAHRFYERAGYRRIKTQAVFTKELAD